MTINRDRLHRELIENAQRNLRELLKYAELEDEERKGIHYGLSCFRKKYTDQEFTISSELKIQSVFKKYVYPAIRIAIERLIKEKRESTIDPQLEEFISPMKKKSMEKFKEMKPEAQDYLIGKLAIAHHKVRNLKLEIRYFRIWMMQPRRVFTDKLAPIL